MMLSSSPDDGHESSDSRPGEFVLNIGLGNTLSETNVKLFEAVKSKDVKKVVEVFREVEGSKWRSNSVTRNYSDLDLNCRNEEGHTCLGLACEEGRVEIVDLLIQVRYLNTYAHR